MRRELGNIVDVLNALMETNLPAHLGQKDGFGQTDVLIADAGSLLDEKWDEVTSQIIPTGFASKNRCIVGSYSQLAGDVRTLANLLNGLEIGD